MSHGDEIDTDTLEEIREILEYALENRRWHDVEDALEMMNDVLGYEGNEDDDLEE